MELFLTGMAIGAFLGVIMILVLRAMGLWGNSAMHAGAVGELKLDHYNELSKMRAEFAAQINELESAHLIDIKRNREDAVNKSKNILKGKIGEHMAPLLEEFSSKYELSEARFMGAPIDYIVFQNLDSRGTGQHNTHGCQERQGKAEQTAKKNRGGRPVKADNMGRDKD